VELFSICGQGGDASAWEEFMCRFNPVIARSVLRVAIRHGISENTVIDDLIQETYLKICSDECRLLRNFVPRHPESAFAYLKVIASSIALDHFKAQHAGKRDPGTPCEVLDEAAAVPVSSTKTSLSPPERAVLINQIDRKLVALVPADEVRKARIVFWLYYRAGFTASAIASLPAVGLTTKGVESLLFRLTTLIRNSLTDVAGSDESQEKGLKQAESF